MGSGRSQNSGGLSQEEQGIIEEVGGRIVRVIFPPLSPQKVSILSLSDRKAYTFFAPKKDLPLSVNALRFNQPALHYLLN